MVKLKLPKEATFNGPAVVWKRALAFLIDIIIIDFIIGFPLRNIVMKLVPSSGFSSNYGYLTANPKTTAILSLVMFMFGFLVLLYFSILERKTGQTLGKIFMNIKVESLNKDLTFLACMVRSMYLVFFFPFVLLWVIDPLFMIFSKDGRRLSEILSRTKTVERYALR